MSALQTSGWVMIISCIISVGVGVYFSNEREVKPQAFSGVFIAIPTLLMAFGLINDHNIADVIEWMYLNTALYVRLVVCLCLSGFAGAMLDAAISIIRDFRKNGFRRLSFRDVFRLVKFGDVNEIISGKGVFDLSKNNIVYGILSNLAGAFCPISMLVFIKTLPDFLSFLENTEWITYYELIGPAMVVPVLLQNLSQQRYKRPVSVESDDPNPDNYLMNRFHMFCYSVSLWFTNTTVLVLGFLFLTYTLYNVHKYTISWLFILPILSLIAFLLYIALSPTAVKYRMIDLSAYRMGKWIVAGIVAVVLALYRFSWSSVVIIVLFLIVFRVWDFLIRIVGERTKEIEMVNKVTQWIRWILIISVVTVMIAVILQQKMHS